jgi:DNA-binding NtrC family response regulator
MRTCHRLIPDGLIGLRRTLKGMNSRQRAGMRDIAVAAVLRHSIRVALASPPKLNRVVVVEDDPPTLGLIERWLIDAGYYVVTCARFEQAKTYLASHTPDILLADVRLGAFNGLQLALLVKADHPAVRVIVFSQHDDPVLHTEAVRCGASFVRTPASSATLLGYLNQSEKTS